MLADVARASNAAARVYCTAFDANYLCRGLALWRSLRDVLAEANLWICCLDQRTEDILTGLALPQVHLFNIGQLEDRFPRLVAVKAHRSRIEYYFTATPSVVRYVFERAINAAAVTYLDADLYFFADPAPLFEELAAAEGSVGIIAHRFPPRLRDREKYGIYNVGWLTFKRDATGSACLDDWQQRCIDWCYARLEDGKFADQKYLDAWPTRFAGIVVLQHAGANVALWNLDHAEVTERDGKPVVNGTPLLFYHFHAITRRLSWLFHTSASAYGERLGAGARRFVYAPYLRAWRDIEEAVERDGLGLADDNEAMRSRSSLARTWDTFRGVVLYLRHIRGGDYLVGRRSAASAGRLREQTPDGPAARRSELAAYARARR